jgi:hydroxypyruvate isomerase
MVNTKKNLSLCLEMLFTDRPFVERMEIASQLGYRAVEFWDWRDKDLPALAHTATRLGLTIAAISGNRRHALIDPAARAGLIEEMERVFTVAEQLSCRHVMMLSDVLRPDGSAAPIRTLSKEDKLESMVAGLRALSKQAEKAGITLLLEPLNTELDHRKCFLDDSATGVEIVQRVGSRQVKLLYDIYHMSMMGEDILDRLETNLPWIGHIHVADMPGRHQPGTGRIPYKAVNALLSRIGYKGFIGMEFSALGPDVGAARVPLEIFV